MRNTLLLFPLLLLFSCNQDSNSLVKKTNGFDFISNPIVVAEQEVNPLSIGAKAPDFKLPGADLAYHSLSDYDASKVLAIVFTCNHCPTAQAYEERLKMIADKYPKEDFQLLAISPNSPLGLLPEELGYSDLGDDFEDMVIRAKKHDFNFPYLYDGDDQKVSLAYGPAATPHAFVFDENRMLQYIGRIDKSEKPGTAHAEDLISAIDLLIDDQTIPTPMTKTFGCSTKWGWKTKLKKDADKQWNEKTVTLQEASLSEVSKIIANGSDKLRLVNVWASWCAPCKLEYPNFMTIQRMFGDRDFEFISISADKLEKKESAIKFLQAVPSPVANYIVSNDDKYALIESIDPEWNGALPYTLLINPDGSTAWSYQGEVDFFDLKTAIVDHEMIGRVY